MSKGPSTRVSAAGRKTLSIYVGTSQGKFGPRPYYAINASYFDKEANEFKRKEFLDVDDMAHLMTLIPSAMGATQTLMAQAKSNTEYQDSPGSEQTSTPVAKTTDDDEIPF